MILALELKIHIVDINQMFNLHKEDDLYNSFFCLLVKFSLFKLIEDHFKFPNIENLSIETPRIVTTYKFWRYRTEPALYHSKRC